MDIEKVQDEIIEEFSMFDNPMDKYEYIIDLGKALPPLDEHLKTEENIVKGCQSKVWLWAGTENSTIHYKADSDTVITKGIIALLIRVLSGRKADEILNTDLRFIDEIDLRAHLSSQRSNGLNAMIKQIKFYAIALNNKK
ncbi:MAG: SufE family protein [Chitinophagaceae bacterium]|nr:MAG: SufE family protein [Chitinophagaceae bacterium]